MRQASFSWERQTISMNKFTNIIVRVMVAMKRLKNRVRE
jgi:hypothetical protein